jgi:hypothetical protein
MRKSNWLQRSRGVFSTGVPVNESLLLAGIVFTVLLIWDRGFLMA